MAAGAGVATPLRLKDLLELDCDSCSAAGFRCYPRRLGESAPIMRHLLESPRSLQLRRPSKLSNLSRSLSRRLGRGGLWRRRSDDHEDAAAPSGSGSDSSETTTSNNSFGRRRRGSRCGSDSDFSTASSASDTMDGTAAAVVAAAIEDEHEAMKRRGSSSGSEADDKDEQLSPVAVMDFPDDDDDDDDCDGGERDAGACACSPPPSFSLERLQRRKMLRQHKIRRFGSTEELGPVDLDARLAATSDTDDPADGAPAQQAIPCRSNEDATAASRRSSSRADVRHDPDEEHGLLALLMDAGVDHISKQLLLDFFVEMRRLSSPAGLLRPRNAERRGDGEVLAAARGWLADGAASERWGLSDVLRAGETVVEEMERSRRWMRVGEEEREVGAVVAGMLADRLVDEVVWDLLV